MFVKRTFEKKIFKTCLQFDFLPAEDTATVLIGPDVQWILGNVVLKLDYATI